MKMMKVCGEMLSEARPEKNWGAVMSWHSFDDLNSTIDNAWRLSNAKTIV